MEKSPAITLRVGYLRESPVWKATYRILLDGDEEPKLQGWAVIDNSGDDDWEDVSLALIAGLPVSFVHDLYTPRYVRRPVVEVRETTGVLPPMAEAGYGEVLSVDSGLTDFDAVRAAPRSSAKMRVFAEASRGGGMAAPSAMQQQTRERQVGDHFEYAVDHPVTVKRNQSALVPIVGAGFEGRRVLLYQKQARAENPVRCVEFVRRRHSCRRRRRSWRQNWRRWRRGEGQDSTISRRNVPTRFGVADMGMPAARLTDMHVCPMLTGPVPHVGGPISGPGCPTVLVAKLPAARATDLAVCTGPPDTIAMGSPTVLIGSMPAARLGDSCAHGGSIVAGAPTVVIG